jgi:anti-sigma-K factor RskA
MSEIFEPEEGAPDMPAAEYVLGTLEPIEAYRVEQRMASDPALASEVRFWEAKLHPLTTLAGPVPPPADLWARIEATTGTTASVIAMAPRAANDNRVAWWRATALGGFAIAAALAVFIGVRVPLATAPAGTASFAVLAPTGSKTPVLVAFRGPDGSIQVRPSTAITVASDRDLQLWALAEGATKPDSLGVLPAGGTRLPSSVVAGTQLLVSLEPKGGSPTGLPTGPVVYGGVWRVE